MGAVLVVGPKLARGVAISGRVRRREDLIRRSVVSKRVTRIFALIVACVGAARVVRVVLNLGHVTVEVAAGVDKLELTDTAADRQLRIFELIVVVRWVIQLYRQVGQRMAQAIVLFLPKHAVVIDCLVGLGDQRGPVVIGVP